MLKEKNKPIYKGIIALFSIILVILLGFTINVNAISIAGQYQQYDFDYEEKPTFTYSYGLVISDIYTTGTFMPFETLIPYYDEDGYEIFDDYPYTQSNYCNDGLISEYLDLSLQTIGVNTNDFSISFDSVLTISSNIGDIRQLNYYFDDFYYEQEDYEYIPYIYTTNIDKYYNVSYLVDAEYLNPTTFEMERRTFSQTLYGVTEFYLIPNLIGYIYTLAPGETYPNTLFKVHYSQCYISLNQDSLASTLNYENNFVYHCLDVSTSEYYEDIDDKFYQIKANNEDSITETLGEQIGGFLDIEILPGLSFLGILGLALGIPLLIWILKLFLGG